MSETIILGSVYSGIATPTETAAIGVAVANAASRGRECPLIVARAIASSKSAPGSIHPFEGSGTCTSPHCSQNASSWTSERFARSHICPYTYGLPM